MPLLTRSMLGASEKFGYRKTVITCLTLIIIYITIFFTAPNIQTLLVGEILCGKSWAVLACSPDPVYWNAYSLTTGMPWGVFQTLTITYASEVCPIALRGYLTTYVNCCWGLGQLIAIGVIRSMFTRTDQWAYRIPYALQWMWPVPLVIGVAFAPESPW